MDIFKILKFFVKLFGNFLDFLGDYFWRNFLGDIFWEDFFGGYLGRIFLGGILWECKHIALKKRRWYEFEEPFFTNMAWECAELNIRQLLGIGSCMHKHGKCMTITLYTLAWLWLWTINIRLTKLGSFLPKNDQV